MGAAAILLIVALAGFIGLAAIKLDGDSADLDPAAARLGGQLQRAAERLGDRPDETTCREAGGPVFSCVVKTLDHARSSYRIHIQADGEWQSEPSRTGRVLKGCCI